MGTEALKDVQTVIKANAASHLEVGHLNGGREALGACVGILIKLFKLSLITKATSNISA